MTCRKIQLQLTWFVDQHNVYLGTFGGNKSIPVGIRLKRVYTVVVQIICLPKALLHTEIKVDLLVTGEELGEVQPN